MPAEPAAYRPVIVIPVYNHSRHGGGRRQTPALHGHSRPSRRRRLRPARAGSLRTMQGHGRRPRPPSVDGRAGASPSSRASRPQGRRASTHALVFDAGGRHDPAAVGSFLELSRKHSNDLVCGYARTSSAYPARARLARRMADAGACLGRTQSCAQGRHVPPAR